MATCRLIRHVAVIVNVKGLSEQSVNQLPLTFSTLAPYAHTGCRGVWCLTTSSFKFAVVKKPVKVSQSCVFNTHSSIPFLRK